MTQNDTEIAVVGGGIVGLACALGLRQAGFSVRILEQRKLPASTPAEPAEIDPRVYAITPASATFLDALGVWSALPANRCTPILGMKIWDRRPDVPLQFDHGHAEQECLGWIIEHRVLHEALLQALDRDLIQGGVEVEAIHIDPQAAHLQLSGNQSLSARLIVGAEGANSRVREAADVDVVSWDYDAEAVVAHVRTTIPHQGIAIQRFFKGGAAALLPLHDGRRSLVWSTTCLRARALRERDDAAFCREIEDLFQSEVGPVSHPTRRLGFPLRLMHARQYAGERCALLGDSAHVIHPLAGQGLNLGLGDARELVRRVSMSRDQGRDWSSQRCLRGFQRARKADNLEMLALTDALGRAWSVPGLDRVLGRGLQGVDRALPIKRLLARRAIRS